MEQSNITIQMELLIELISKSNIAAEEKQCWQQVVSQLSESDINDLIGIFQKDANTAISLSQSLKEKLEAVKSGDPEAFDQSFINDEKILA